MNGPGRKPHLFGMPEKRRRESPLFFISDTDLPQVLCYTLYESGRNRAAVPVSAYKQTIRGFCDG